MAISERTSNIVYSTNSSILTGTDLSEPVPTTLNPKDLFLAFNLIFETSPNGIANLNLTTDSLLLYLNSYLDVAGKTPTGVQATGYLRALLAIPLLLFQQTWFNPSLQPSPDEPVSGLDKAFYVTADLAHSAPRAFIPRWTVIFYTLVNLSVFLWCVGGMCVTLFIQRPPITPFELIDFASKVVSNRENQSMSTMLANISNGDEDITRKTLEDKGLFVGDVGIRAVNENEVRGGEDRATGTERIIGFALNSNEVQRFSRRLT